MVRVEMITPEEYKNEYANFKILYAIQPTPFGSCLIGVRDTDKAILHLAFADKGLKDALRTLESDWALSELQEDNEHRTENIVQKVFAENTKLLDSISVVLKGTEFQTEVWQALMTIPQGTTTTYEKVAQMINRPKAIRAVANALMKNKIAYIVPCHRVMGKSGSNKYSWGAERKQSILTFENGLH